jgi:alpha-L-fucosidase 2
MERIVLLPALPKAWRDGSIKGLRVKGGASLCLEWQEGCLTGSSLKADKELHTIVVYGKYKEEVHLQAGEEKQLVFR